MSNSVNIEKIMQEIQQKLAQEAHYDVAVSFDDIQVPNERRKMEHRTGAMALAISDVNGYHIVQPERPIVGGGLLGRVKAFMKKLLRKATRFLIYPNVYDQNNCNHAILIALSEAKQELGILYAENQELAGTVEMLELKMSRMQKRMDAMQSDFSNDN